MSDYWKEVQAGPKTAEPPPLKVLVPTNEALVRKTNSAANLLWFVVVVSAINMVLVQIQAPIRFVFGLEFTDVIYAIGLGAASAAGSLGNVFVFGALAINAVLLGLLAVLGWRAKQRATWAFAASLVFVSLDVAAIAWVTMKTNDLPLMSLLVHGVAIYSLVLGMNAAKLYTERKKNGDAP